MGLPKSVDLDRVVGLTLWEIGTAIGRWREGSPTDEVALMNHITGRLNRRRRGCDVGSVTPVSMEARLATLHRQGRNQTDRYGSDLAVTVFVKADGFLKTAFLQFKKTSGDYRATLEFRQLNDAAADPRVLNRSFISVTDEIRAGSRMQLVKDALQGWPGGQATRSVDASAWDGLVVWMYKWLKCDIGEESNPDKPDRIEVLLEPYFLPERPTFDGPLELLDGVLPARSWLILEFTPEEREMG
jgi:hypothetical protein